MPLARVLGKPPPALFGELHPLPVVVSRLVLTAEFHAKRFGRSALGRGDVRLEFHGICARIGNRIHKRMCEPKTAVVRQRDFADDETASGSKNWLRAQGSGLKARSRLRAP